MNGKEVLENIVINFDNMGMICSNLGYEEFYAKDLHFKEIFKTEYESILKDLDRLEKLEKAIDILKEAVDEIEIITCDEEDCYGELCLYQKINGSISIPLKTKEEYILAKEILENE